MGGALRQGEAGDQSGREQRRRSQEEPPGLLRIQDAWSLLQTHWSTLSRLY